jgi:outer membrane protein assembly factor BamB
MIFTARILLSSLAFTIAAQGANWPQWRGPAFNGTSPEKGLPSEITKESILWKTELPSFSGATPAVWGDSIFVVSPDANKDLHLMCLDRKDGKVRWQQKCSTGDINKGKGNMASPSPITDGRLVYALFGTGDLLAFDFAGKQVWKRDLGADYGKFAIMWTYGSSPLLYGGKLYVQVLQRTPAPSDYPGMAGAAGDRESYLLALEPATGKTLWKHVRPTNARLESMESYSTPVPHEAPGGKPQILLVGGDCVSGHDAATGEELWRGYGINRKGGEWMRVVPSVVSADGLAIACGPKQEPAIAFRTDLKGDITSSGVAWSFDEKQTPDVCTPAYSNGRLFALNGDKQTLTCLDAKTGSKIWQGKLGNIGVMRSSPTVADGKVYTISENGSMVVCDANGPDFKILSTFQFEGAEPTRSAVAVSDGRLYVRTANALYCVGK